jgi:hypothetical protein
LSRIPQSFLPTIVLLAMTALAACAGYPAQQMYDARQAIRAADKAGAARYAPEEFGAAREHLKSAENGLHSGDYRSARDEAEQAREKAMEARRRSEAATAHAVVPPAAPNP